eukprot:snap_masked-scaffold356_size197960-processed-gene-0.10 protein:Tk00525 transcript:snap_masked-scaffold356_size197960-processed-gene-0.10-mRNA-1 annotation:"Peroxidasin"
MFKSLRFSLLLLGLWILSSASGQTPLIALRHAFHDLEELDRLEQDVYRQGQQRQAQLKHGAQGMHASINRPTLEAVRNSRLAMVYEFTTLHLSTDSPGRSKRQLFNNLLANMAQEAARGVNQALGLTLSNTFTGVRSNAISSLDDIPDPPESVPEFDIPVQEVLGIHGGSVLDSPVCSQEAREMRCDPQASYRSLSGRCNNLARPNWGKHLVPLRRYFGPVYDDGVARPKIRSVTGPPLPNVRSVSTRVHHDASNLDTRFTLMLMQWGQFLDHDITSTPSIRGLNGSVLDCSGCEANGRHPGCYPILVPRADKYFPVREPRSGARKCIPFTRSLPGQTKLGPREQLNQNTAYLDASHLYGSHPCRLDDLRLHQKGHLRVLEHPKSKVFKDLMPRNKENEECRSLLGLCFHTGDDRSNEQPGLTSMHTLFLREHNRLADRLLAVNPLWNDEKTFQEARKILMAINQHISYKEFLPRVLGSGITSAFGLDLESQGYYQNYDPSCSADIHNEFATAAFRFGHSLIRPMFSMFSSTMKAMKDAGVSLRHHFNNPDVVYGSHFIDQVIRGMVMTPMEQFDSSITEELTNHLFQERGKAFSGMDLAALNLQRGRDHGLPGYTKYRELCLEKFKSNGFNQTPAEMFQPIREWTDLKDAFSPDVAAILSSLYRHVDDIDLFTGGLAELPLNGAVVGPTFACLIADQFQKVRQCDRFWYETPDENLRFAPEQLQEIRKVTLSSLICRNCDIFSPMPSNAFDIVDATNALRECEDHPEIDIAQWQDTKANSGRDDRVLQADQLPFCDIEGRVVLPGQRVRISACVECECREQKTCYSVKHDVCSDLIEDAAPEAVVIDTHCPMQCRREAKRRMIVQRDL